MGLLSFAVSGLALVALERVPRLRFRDAPFVRRFMGSDALHVVTGVGFGLLTGGLVLTASTALGALGLPRLSAVPMPLALSVAPAIVVLDLGQYASHRMLHHFGALWEIHKVHHSPRALDWLAGYRSHVFEHALRRVVGPLGLVLLGAPAEAVAIAASILSAWAAFIHSNVDLHSRALELVLVTPRLHRVHHVPATTTRNFGAFLTVWDRLAGAFVAEPPPADAALGVPAELETYPQTWWAQLTEPIRRFVRPRGA